MITNKQIALFQRILCGGSIFLILSVVLNSQLNVIKIGPLQPLAQALIDSLNRSNLPIVNNPTTHTQNPSYQPEVREKQYIVRLNGDKGVYDLVGKTIVGKDSVLNLISTTASKASTIQFYIIPQKKANGEFVCEIVDSNTNDSDLKTFVNGKMLKKASRLELHHSAYIQLIDTQNKVQLQLQCTFYVY